MRRSSTLVPFAALCLVAGSARAQSDTFDARTAAHVLHEYTADLDTVHSKILALANAIPADKYSWRPGPGVRSVSEVFMHMAEEWYYWGPQSVGAMPPADFGTPKEAFPKLAAIADKTQVLEQLELSWNWFSSQLAAANAASLTGSYAPWKMPLDKAAFGMTGDQHEHLGQMIAYARVLGVKPPWSK